MTPNRDPSHNLSIDRLLKMTSSELMDIFFGKKLNDFRKSVETQSPQVQCKRVIGKCCETRVTGEPAFYDAKVNTPESKSYCWICGYGLTETQSHCEHIVPVLFACLFGGLHSRTKSQVFTSAMKNIINQNYKYAHSSCNIVKSDLLLFKWDGNAMVFDRSNANLLFDKIQTVNKTDDYKMQFLRNLENHIRPICDLINAEYKDFTDSGIDMTGYIKYTINCTSLYLSAENKARLLTDAEQRRKMNEYLADIEQVLMENKESDTQYKISTGALADILNNSDILVSEAISETPVYAQPLTYMQTPKYSKSRFNTVMLNDDIECASNSCKKRSAEHAPDVEPANKKHALSPARTITDTNYIYQTPKKGGKTRRRRRRTRRSRKQM